MIKNHYTRGIKTIKTAYVKGLGVKGIENYYKTWEKRS